MNTALATHNAFPRLADQPAPFATGEGLRATLKRLHSSGPDAWRDDPEARDLMQHCVRKYGALARRHRMEPADAAAAAFEVMRMRSTRTAGDPWAVVTRAVQVTLIAEDRAQGLLCSTAKARRASVSAHHDAERFSDRETPISDFHPAFHVAAEQDLVEIAEHPHPTPTTAFHAVELAVSVFCALGWPTDTASAALEYIASRLIESGSRSTAYEMLRRDHHARALLDLSRASWNSVLRVTLGNQSDDHTHTSEGRGQLLRLLVGETVAELLADDKLVLDVSLAAPAGVRTGCG
jgi:hypothetical protein